MKVVVVGATGLIGGETVGALIARGHEVVPVARGGRVRRGMWPETVRLDLGRATMADWLPLLAGADAVVNCAGVLQASASDHPDAAHARGPDLLFAACEAAGVRRVIHFSAVGVDRGARSSFSATKTAGDEALAARDLDWVILRPSVVLGRPVFGASALLRGLAAQPLVPRTAEAGPLQVVRLEDVVATVVRLVEAPRPARVALELVGPDRLSFDAVVALYRRWYGWAPARVMSLTSALYGLFYRLGDVAARFGWRPAVRSNAQAELGRGAVGDPTAWREATGIEPTDLSDVLAASPPSVQDRWFAKLFFLKPLIFVVLALFWIATGVVSIGPGYAIGVEHMLKGGAGAWSSPVVIAGGLADFAIGVAIAFRPTARAGLYGALAVSLFYAAAGTAIRPDLWIEPLGPMLKIGPIIVLNLVALAILEDR
jgi:uncharacterized protein YbjT (DUF2867 family)